MARTKRASSRRTGTRKASARKASTRRKKTSTRRPSTRRTSTSRKKRSTRSRKPKGLRLTRKKQKKILIIVGVIVALLLLIGFLQSPRFKVDPKKAGTVGEIARNAVYGKVTNVAIGVAGRGFIRVQSFKTGKTYTFYTGVRTRYNIKSYPSAGDTAKVYYIYDRGYLKATYVRLR
jgi:hypothetical protein